MSKGKYLFNLDNDDLFVNNDIFDTITKLSDKGNFVKHEIQRLYIFTSKTIYIIST